MKHYKLGLLLLLLVAAVSCRRDPDLTGVAEVSYQNDIRRIMSGNCAFPDCHGGEQGPSLNTYEGVSGEVKPGDARKSELYRIVTGRSFTVMPPSGYPDMSAEDIKLLYTWIQQGAKNN